MRSNGRKNNEMRLIGITQDYIKYPEGSVLIQFGDTKVICNATITEGTQPFLKGTGQGWITAEYSMLPRATHSRNQREAQKGKLTGRTQEISRLIGRSLRSAVDMLALGERTIIIDCDVIQADGGTRTASISGGFVAMYLAVEKLLKNGIIEENPIKRFVSAVSVGLYQGLPVLDLDYHEDSSAEVDMNIVATSEMDIVEIQGTGEHSFFTQKQLNEMLELGFIGIQNIYNAQLEVIKR